MADQNAIVSSLLDEMGLADISEEKKEELLAKMTEALLKKIFVETVEKLSETDQEKYAELIDKNAAPDVVEEFLMEKIPGYDEMLKKIAEDFKKEMLNAN